MNNGRKRFLSLLLAAVMLLSLCPVAVLAEEGEEQTEAAEEVREETAETEEPTEEVPPETEGPTEEKPSETEDEGEPEAVTEEQQEKTEEQPEEVTDELAGKEPPAAEEPPLMMTALTATLSEQEQKAAEIEAYIANTPGMEAAILDKYKELQNIFVTYTHMKNPEAPANVAYFSTNGTSCSTKRHDFSGSCDYCNLQNVAVSLNEAGLISTDILSPIKECGDAWTCQAFFDFAWAWMFGKCYFNNEYGAKFTYTATSVEDTNTFFHTLKPGAFLAFHGGKGAYHVMLFLSAETDRIWVLDNNGSGPDIGYAAQEDNIVQKSAYTYKYIAPGGGKKVTEFVVTYPTIKDLNIILRDYVTECTISLDPQGGTMPYNNPYPLTQPVGALTAEFPTPFKTGMEFLGWFTAPEGGTEFPTGSLVPRQKSLTLYAHWGMPGSSTPSFDTPNRDGNTANCTIYTAIRYSTVNKPTAWGLDVVTNPNSWVDCSRYSHNITASELSGGSPIAVSVDLSTISYSLNPGTTYYYRFWVRDTKGNYAHSVVQNFKVEKSILVVASGTCGDDLTWTLDESGLLTISGTGDMMNWDYGFDVPWASQKHQIKTAQIEDGVTSIGSGAFYECSSLTSVTIPDSVTSIGDDAFNGCESLTSITIPESVENIGFDAFYRCHLTSIFVDAENEFYSSVDGVLFSKDQTTLICYPCGKSGSYVIPDSVSLIGDNAFSVCDNLTSITIPNSVTNIGSCAFYFCTGLTSITIPGSVESLGYSPFYGDSSLMSITVAEDNQTFSSKDGVLFDKNQTALICCPAGKSDSYSIPAGVESIGINAFYGNINLTNIMFPETVTTIGDYAFFDCISLTNIVLPEGLTSIGSSAFILCVKLASVTIPESVESIGAMAFAGCTALTDIYYTGTEAQWNAIDMDEDAIPETVTIHFNWVVDPLSEGQHLTPISAPTGDEPLADFSVEVSYGGANKAEAQRQIAGIVNDNPAVRDFADSKLRAAVAGKEDTLLAALQVDGLTADDLILGVSMVPKAATVVEEEDGARVTKMSFEVRPTVTAFVEGMEAPITAVIPNSALSAPVTIRLPIDKTVPVNTIVKVQHNGEYFGSFAVQVEDGNKFIEFAATGFSTFSYELTKDTISVDDLDVSGSLTLKENINVNFYVTVTKGTVDDYKIKRTTSTTYGKNDEQPVPLKSVKTAVSGKEYKFVADTATASEMTKSVFVTIYYKDVEVVTYEYSVLKYCEDMIENEKSGEEIVALCKATLDFGTYAQLHFNENTDALANAHYSLGSLPTVPEYGLSVSAALPDMYFSAASLVLRSETSIKIYVQTKNGHKLKASDFSCSNGTLGDFRNEGGGEYSIKICGIGSSALDNDYTVTVSDGTGTMSLTYSALTYAYRNQNVEKDHLGDLCKALYQYNQCADAYFK